MWGGFFIVLVPDYIHLLFVQKDSITVIKQTMMRVEEITGSLNNKHKQINQMAYIDAKIQST
jgi:hypothetical protein